MRPLACSVAIVAVLLATLAWSQLPKATENDHYSTSNCMGCHGQSAMGGLGPPIAKTKLTYEQFHKTVREGKGMMPATAAAQASDDEVRAIYDELRNKPWRPELIPIAYKVGQFLSTRNVGTIFFVVFGVAFLLSIPVTLYWLRLAAIGYLWPGIRRLGLARSAWIVLRSLVVDGLCVASLYRRNRFRWVMHGLIFYGFLGLLAADILMAIFNPTRGTLPLHNPLKLLPIVSGLSVMMGMFYVQYRYRSDEFIDNGLTQGRDFLFVNLLFHTVLSGFLTVVIKRAGIADWVMTVYLYHLASVSLLVLTAPYTRFMHAWIVPLMVALTRLTEQVAASGDLAFLREPSPGRHHKSLRIAEGVMRTLEPGTRAKVRLRYYP